MIVISLSMLSYGSKKTELSHLWHGSFAFFITIFLETLVDIPFVQEVLLLLLKLASLPYYSSNQPVVLRCFPGLHLSSSYPPCSFISLSYGITLTITLSRVHFFWIAPCFSFPLHFSLLILFLSLPFLSPCLPPSFSTPSHCAQCHVRGCHQFKGFSIFWLTQKASPSLWAGG